MAWIFVESMISVRWGCGEGESGCWSGFWLWVFDGLCLSSLWVVDVLCCVVTVWYAFVLYVSNGDWLEVFEWIWAVRIWIGVLESCGRPCSACEETVRCVPFVLPSATRMSMLGGCSYAERRRRMPDRSQVSHEEMEPVYKLYNDSSQDLDI